MNYIKQYYIIYVHPYIHFSVSVLFSQFSYSFHFYSHNIRLHNIPFLQIFIMFISKCNGFHRSRKYRSLEKWFFITASFIHISCGSTSYFQIEQLQEYSEDTTKIQTDYHDIYSVSELRKRMLWNVFSQINFMYFIQICWKSFIEEVYKLKVKLISLHQDNIWKNFWETENVSRI